MSWLGKILTFVVLIAALVGAYFTVNSYVVRTNWKARADGYEKAFKESEAARLKEQRDFQAERDALVRLYAVEQSRSADLSRTLADVTKAGKTADDKYKELERNYREADVQAKILAANLATTIDQLTTANARNTTLENGRVSLVLAKANADRRAVQSKLEADNELKKRLAEEAKVETLRGQVAELRANGGGGGQATVLRAINKVPAPLPDNIRGTVVRDIVGDFVEINIGIDAGLEPGSQLDVYRETGTGKYLGTLVITRTIYPKKAVAEFKPARAVPIAQLRPEELPRKGDTVGHVSDGPGLRNP